MTFELQASPISVYAIALGTVPCLRRMPGQRLAGRVNRTSDPPLKALGATGSRSAEAVQEPFKNANHGTGSFLGRSNGPQGRKSYSLINSTMLLSERSSPSVFKREWHSGPRFATLKPCK